MSRIGKQPVPIPSGVDVKLDGRKATVKGPKGLLSRDLPLGVEVEISSDSLQVLPPSRPKENTAFQGLARTLLNNMVVGVTEGFEKKLELIGVGYRAQAQGNKLNLSLGFSHPVEYAVPEGISIETPSQTEILVKGADKQKVGQVCAEIRAYRPPEPYKGKGVRYSDEHVRRKEAKKK